MVRAHLTRLISGQPSLLRRTTISLAALTLLVAPYASAQIEQSVGPDGVITFSNSKSQKKSSSAAKPSSTQRAPAGSTPSGRSAPTQSNTPTRPSSAASQSAHSTGSSASYPGQDAQFGPELERRISPYREAIREAAALYRLPEALIIAVMKTESNFDPRATSPVGACGLMQLMPPTAERMMVTDIYDPRQNILGGARYLRILANLFNGDLHLTAAAYNAGEGAVIRYGGIPPYAETEMYVRLVVERYERYQLGQ